MDSRSETSHLRHAIVTALRRVECGWICRTEPERFRDQGTRGSVIFSSSVFLGLVLFLVTVVNLGVLPSVGIVFGSLLFAVVILSVTNSQAYTTVLLIFIGIWLVTFFLRAITSGLSDALVLYVFPFLAVYFVAGGRPSRPSGTLGWLIGANG